MFVSVEQLQEYSGVSDNENMASIYLSSSQEIVEEYLGYSLLQQNYKTYISGNNAYSCLLEAKPIIELTKISIDGVEMDLSKFAVKDEILIALDGNTHFTTGMSNIIVEYTAGFTVYDPDSLINPGDPAPMYCPGLITMTILRIAALLQSEADGNIGITSKSFGESGARTFIQTTNYDKYLNQISKYKLVE